MNEESPEPRQERRERRRASREAKMAKHGKGLIKVYRDAILKKLGLGKSDQQIKP